jgi:hypothetical protein
VDSAAPRLSWKLAGSRHGQRQTAYQILVASSPQLLARARGDCWDSGKVDSGETLGVPYAGKPLASSAQVFWKVRAWDKNSRASGWSQTASWTMGVLRPLDWNAHWVGAASATNTPTLLLRRQFTVKPGLRRAVAHVCGLGCYEMSLNGLKVGDALFPPGWSKYDRSCLYDTYEITSLLRHGDNAIGLLLGNGMYNVRGGRYTKFTGSFGPLQAIGQVRLEYTDGSVEILGTDVNWRVSPGPITFSCVYGGEDYDARLEPHGWNRAGFDDAKWACATLTQGPGGTLKGLSCAAPPIRAFDILKPVKLNPLRPGVTVYDLGQNASLMPRLSMRGSAGSIVRITPAELLAQHGSIDRSSCGNAKAYWQYTLAGGGTETWFPKFFYHGCRYLQVECSAPNGGSLPVVQALEGVVVHSASLPVGDFSCSNPLFNRIRNLVRWAQRSNMMSVMTDCPHREKLGWLEEDHLNGPSLRYEFDLAQLFTKALNDMADSQLANGLVPDIAPEYVQFRNGFRDSPEWGSAIVLVPWQQYEFTGDLELLRRHYDEMKRYVDYLGSRATNHIVSHGLGDWYDLGPKPPGVAQLTPVPLTASAFYFYDTWILAQIADILHNEEDAQQLHALASQIRAAFNQTFFDPNLGRYATGSQCANAIPLVMGLAEPPHRPHILDSIVADVRDRGNALTAGDVGYRYLLRALADGGRSDVLYEMNNQSARPGYGFQLAQGATSLTEAWDAGRHSSQNHFMLGQILEWFYHDLAGITSASPGFKKVVIKPAPVGDLKWVKASYDSVHGLIVSDWQRQGTEFTLQVTIPPNTTATVYVPHSAVTGVASKDLPVSKPAARLLGFENGFARYETGSGRYVFRSHF